MAGFAKTFFLLLLVARADAGGLRSRAVVEKEQQAIAGLRELVEADEHFNVLALLREAGIHEMSASWECDCLGDGGEFGHLEEAGHGGCECECRPRNDEDGWDAVDAHDGAGIPCTLELGVRTASGGVRNLDMDGIVARRGESDA